MRTLRICTIPSRCRPIIRVNRSRIFCSQIQSVQPVQSQPTIVPTKGEELVKFKNEKEYFNAVDPIQTWPQTFRNLFYYLTGIVSTYALYQFAKASYQSAENRPNFTIPEKELSDQSIPMYATWYGKYIPNRALSRSVKAIMDVEIPYLWLRKLIYKTYGTIYNVNWNEYRPDIEYFASMKEFFVRPLHHNRQISLHSLISPCDARVLAFGQVQHNENADASNLSIGDAMLEQVKGVRFNVKGFLGDSPKMKDETNHGLYYAILYLSPGDYHRFHMSCDMRVERVKHMPGYLYAVKPSWLNKIPGLFSLNERVVIEGSWNPSLEKNNDWYFSYSPVGALFVGNINLHFDNILSTNDASHDPYLWFYRNNLTQPLPQVSNSKHRIFLPYQKIGGAASYTHGFEHSYDQPFSLEKGEEVGYFTFGSTVVLVFEASKFQWCVERGQKIKFGEAMGEIVM